MMQKNEDKNEENDDMRDQNQSNTVTDSLSSFILNQLEFQNNTDSGDNLSQERLKAFCQRALAESEKMRKETLKSSEERKKLYADIGIENMDALTQEHLTENIQNK